MALGDIYTDREVDEAIDQILPGYNHGRELQIPRDVVRTLVRAENMGNTGGVTFANRVSPAGASGVMQVMPATIKGLKGKYLAPDFPEDLSDAPLQHQVIAGIAALREMVDRTKTTDWKNLAMQYNAGPEVAAGKKPVPQETQAYLVKGQRAREALGIETPLPPTSATAQPSPAFQSSPLDNANLAYSSMMTLVPALQTALFGASANAQEAGKIQQQAVLLAGQAAAKSAQTQAEITIQEADFHRQILQGLGLDLQDPNSLLNKELEREAKTRVEREKLGKDIARMQGISFFDNPLQFLMVQGDLQQSVAQYNQLANVENRSTEEIARMQTLATTLKTLTPAKNADLIRAKAQADADQLVRQAEFNAAKISAENSAGYAKNLLDQFTLKRNIFHDILQIEGREWDMKFRQQQFDALLEQRQTMANERKEKREAKELADSQEAALVTGINLYSRAITGANVDLTKEDIKRMPAQIRAAWYEVILRGNYGNNYAEAIPFILQFGNAAQAASTGNAALVQLVRSIDQRVIPLAIQLKNQNNATNPLAPINDKTARELAYQQLYLQDAALASKGADKSIIPQNSPYALDYNAIAIAAAKNPTSAISQVLTDAKARANGGDINGAMTPRMIIDSVRAKVVAGALDPAKAAAEIALFFKTANDQQYEATGLKYIGLPQFTDFVITPGATGTKKVDLYNPAQIENYLTAEVAKEKRFNMFKQEGTGFRYFMQ